MPPSRENVIFDDVIITSTLHKYKVNFESKFYVFSKTNRRDIVCQSSKNMFKFVKVIHGRL